MINLLNLTHTTLLADLRELFADKPSGLLFTSEILAALHARDDRPWPEWKSGKPIMARQLATLLKPFGVRADQTQRRGTETKKGYRVEMFDDAFARYIDPIQPVTPSQVADFLTSDDFRSVTTRQNVTDTILKNPSISAGCDGVTDRNPGKGQVCASPSVTKPNGADHDGMPEEPDIPFWEGGDGLDRECAPDGSPWVGESPPPPRPHGSMRRRTRL